MTMTRMYSKQEDQEGGRGGSGADAVDYKGAY